MGDFAPPNTDLISHERLQRRLDGYRKHHTDNKIHYDNYANAEYEKVNEDTKVLYQKWLEGKNKKTKNKSNKSEVNKDVNQMKPKPKVNAVKPMVINPIVAERGVEPSCPSFGSKPNVNPCNESQKQSSPFQNTPNAGSVHVNINLDANLAQAQNGITLRFSSRITGNNVASSSENNPMTNVNVPSDCGNTQQLCKAETNDLSLCEGDNSELDNFLNSGPVDDDLGIDFEFLNGLDDSCEFFSDANNPLPPSNDVPLSPKGNLVNQSIAPLPNQSIISQQKQSFQNQPTNMQLPSNFSRIELNISSDMSKFSSILGETPGPAAETLKHLAAKHINQEKVQQKMIHSSDMYPMKQCYPMSHMPGNGAFVNDSNAMMGVNNFRLPYSQCQSMGLDGQSNIMVEGMKGKTPPCYQDTKVMYPHQMQVQQQNMQFTEQKLNVAGTMKEGDMKLEMKYDFEQCRLTQESQMLPQSGMNKMYQNCVVSQTNSIQADCFRMQKQKSVAPGYQRFVPYPSQGRPRFVTMGNNNSSVPSSFNQNQIESAGLYDSESYGLMMNSRQQVCMQSQQACGPQRHGGSMALVNPVQTRQNGVKDGMMLEEFKSGSADMMCYPNMNMQINNGAACHSQMNPGLFYGDGQPPPSYHNISPMMMAGPQMRSKWSSMPQGHPMTNKAMATSHMPINYQDVNHQQNYFPESRSYLMNGSQSYQSFHCSNPQQGVQYYTQGQEGMRVIYNAPNQAMVGQSGMNMGYNSNPKRSAPNVAYQAMRMENYNFGY